MLSNFSCVSCPFVYFLWKNVYWSPLPVFSQVGCILLVSFMSFLCILDIMFLLDTICKYIFPFYGLSFYSVDSIFLMHKILRFSWSQFVYFCFCYCASGVINSCDYFFKSFFWFFFPSGISITNIVIYFKICRNSLLFFSFLLKILFFPLFHFG